MKTGQRANRFYDTVRFGMPEIRVYHKAGAGKKSPRYLFKCGCCERKIEVYHDNDSLEINGVNGSIQNWREILLPLLKDKPRFVKGARRRTASLRRK